MALIIRTTERYHEINLKAKRKFRVNWYQNKDVDTDIEAGYALLHNCKTFYSMHGQKDEYDEFIENFIDFLLTIKTDIFILETGTVENHKSPEYFDLPSLQNKYREFAIASVNIDDYFERKIYYGIPIYVGKQDKLKSLINEDFIKIRMAIEDAVKKIEKVGMNDGTNLLQLIGLAPIDKSVNNKLCDREMKYLTDEKMEKKKEKKKKVKQIYNDDFDSYKKKHPSLD